MGWEEGAIKGKAMRQMGDGADSGHGLRLHDLGTLEGPVLIFGGPCSNLQATEAVLALAEAAGIPPARRICTGDMVAYCAAPEATARAVLDGCVAVAAGNVERQLAAGADACGCGFAEGSACDRLAQDWYGAARRALAAAPDLLARFAALPDIVLFRHGGRRHAVLHGGARDIARYLWPSSPEADFAVEIAAIEAAAGPVEVVLAGHCGLAFHRRIGGVDWINAGAVGLPPHDGRPMTRHVILRDDTPAARGVVFQRLAYDHAAAARDMRRAGMPEAYARCLETGLWPSEEVLPPALRRARA